MMPWFKRHPVSEADLSAYIDGQLANVRQAQVSAHLESCDACAAYVADLRSLKALVATLPQEQPARSFTLTPAQAGQRPTPRRSFPAGLALAPAMALTLFVALVGIDLLAVDGGGRGGAPEALTAKYADQGAAVERSAAPAPAASGAEAGAPAPQVPTVGPGLTGPADSAAPDQAKAAEKGGPPEGRAGASNARATEEAVLRALEGLAALAFVGSLAYLILRKRRPSDI